MLVANSIFSKTTYGPSRPWVAVGVRESQVAALPRSSTTARRASGCGQHCPEWKCTSEEFLFSFREYHRELPSSSVFVRRDLWSSCFSWKPVGKRICRALAGRGGGRLFPGLHTQPGWGGFLGGISPQAPGNGPLTTSHWDGPTSLARPDRLSCADPVAVASGTRCQGLEALLPWHALPFSESLRLREQMIQCRCKRNWSDG